MNLYIVWITGFSCLLCWYILRQKKVDDTPSPNTHFFKIAIELNKMVFKGTHFAILIGKYCK